MSPKKNTTGTPNRATSTTTPPHREPAVLGDPRRWPLVLWAILALTWILGSALTFFLAITQAAYITSGVEVTTQDQRDMVGYLAGLLIFALGTPLAGAITATVMRRRIAAVIFAVLLLATAGVLFWLIPPAAMLDATRGAYE